MTTHGWSSFVGAMDTFPFFTTLTDHFIRIRGHLEEVMFLLTSSGANRDSYVSCWRCSRKSLTTPTTAGWSSFAKTGKITFKPNINKIVIELMHLSCNGICFVALANATMTSIQYNYFTTSSCIHMQKYKCL